MKKHPVLRVLTNSERGARACDKRWFFSKVLGLTNHHTPAPLRGGSLWHACLAAWYRSRCTMGEAAIVEAVVAPWLERRAEYAAAISERSQEAADESMDEDQDLASMVGGMLSAYLQRWGDDTKQWEILHVGPQVARWIKHPVTGRPVRDRVRVGADQYLGRRWAYGGEMDLIVRDRADGQVWMVEQKTTVSSDLDAYVRKLHWDPQIRGYAWAAVDPISAVSDIKEPVAVAGVIYDVVRKKVAGPPKLVGASKADVAAMPRGVVAVPGPDGKVEHKRLSAAKIDTTREAFLAEVLRLGMDPGCYADQLEQLRNVRMQHRERYPFTTSDFTDFERDTGASALEVRAASKVAADHPDESWRHPRQTQVCTSPGAMACPYAQICLDDGPMMRRTFYVLGIRHEELRDDMAEPTARREREAMGLKVDATPAGNFDRSPPPAPADPGTFDPFAEFNRATEE